jgi:hypothetical protein
MTETPEQPRIPLPGIAAIALYMLVLSAVVAFGVLGHHFPALFLILSFLFATASIGLLRLYRWGWALTLGAAFLLVCYGCWLFFRFHQGPAIVLAILNMVFFLYLIRPDVIGRLR